MVDRWVPPALEVIREKESKEHKMRTLGFYSYGILIAVLSTTHCLSTLTPWDIQPIKAMRLRKAYALVSTTWKIDVDDMASVSFAMTVAHIIPTWQATREHQRRPASSPPSSGRRLSQTCHRHLIEDTSLSLWPFASECTLIRYDR